MRRGVLVAVLGALLYALPVMAEEKQQSDVTVSGIITDMEADGTVVVMPEKGEGQIIYVRPGTRIVREGREIPYSQLKAGDWVVGKRMEGSDDFLITVLPGPPGSKAK